MLKRKKNTVAIHNYIFILLLTVLLILSLSYGWYSNNKHVSANGLSGQIGEGDIDISKQGAYKQEVGADEPVHPYPEVFDTITGLLSGEYVFYSVSLTSKDDVIKDISIKINTVDGGEYFTMAPVETTVDEFNLYTDEEPVDVYLLDVDTTDGDGNTTTNVVETNTYLDTTTADIQYLNKEFYFTLEDDVYYKNYFYEDENGKRYNMCDVYTINLDSVYFSDAALVDKIYYEDTNATLGNVIDFSNRGNYDKSVSSIEIATYENWNSEGTMNVDGVDVSTSEITFTFKITFDYSHLAEKININCISKKQLIFNNFLIFASESNSGGES